ncbi:MAG: DUF2752 domain-containing protein [Roseburia sp.]
MKKKSHPQNPALDRVFYIIGWVTLALVAVYFLISYITGFQLSRHIAPCYFHAITGLYCPGCGGTRSINFLLQGRCFLSFFYHPFVLYCVVVGGYFMISQTVGLIAKKNFRFILHYHDWMLWAALFLVATNFIIKNLFLLAWGIDLLPLK